MVQGKNANDLFFSLDQSHVTTQYKQDSTFSLLYNLYAHSLLQLEILRDSVSGYLADTVTNNTSWQCRFSWTKQPAFYKSKLGKLGEAISVKPILKTYMHDIFSLQKWRSKDFRQTAIALQHRGQVRNLLPAHTLKAALNSWFYIDRIKFTAVIAAETTLRNALKTSSTCIFIGLPLTRSKQPVNVLYNPLNGNSLRDSKVRTTVYFPSNTQNRELTVDFDLCMYTAVLRRVPCLRRWP